MVGPVEPAEDAVEDTDRGVPSSSALLELAAADAVAVVA